MRPVRADLERVQREPQVVDRARRAREVVDEVDRPCDLEVLDHVVVEELEPLVPDVLDVCERARVQVVDAEDAVALLEEVVAEMRAEEAGASGHESGRHGERCYSAVPIEATVPNEALTARMARKGEAGTLKASLNASDVPCRLPMKVPS